MPKPVIVYYPKKGKYPYIEVYVKPPYYSIATYQSPGTLNCDTFTARDIKFKLTDIIMKTFPKNDPNKVLEEILNQITKKA